MTKAIKAIIVVMCILMNIKKLKSDLRFILRKQSVLSYTKEKVPKICPYFYAIRLLLFSQFSLFNRRALSAMV